jgi:hypothetical protein
LQIENVGYVGRTKSVNSKEHSMNENQRLQAVTELRDMGYAVALFSAEELQGVDPREVENAMSVSASAAIDDLKSDLESEDVFDFSVPELRKTRMIPETEGLELDPHMALPVEMLGLPLIAVHVSKDSDAAFSYQFQSHQDVLNFARDADCQAALLWVLIGFLSEKDALWLAEHHIALSWLGETEREGNDWTMSEYSDEVLRRAGALIRMRKSN